MKAKHIDDFEGVLTEAECKAELDWEKEMVAGLQILYAKFGGQTPVSDGKLLKLQRINDYYNC